MLLTPLGIPRCEADPVTAGDLLIQLSRLEAVVDEANDRFQQIIYIQDNNTLQPGALGDTMMDRRIDIPPSKGD